MGLRMGNAPLVDGMYRDGFLDPLSGQVMGETAETLARQYDISRREQDEYALRSQQRAAAAIEGGRFDAEIVPVQVKGRKGENVSVERDEHPRADSTIEGLRKLAPVFSKEGTVTAGNSSGITDGAAAVVVAGEEIVNSSGGRLEPLVRVVDYEFAGVAPEVMGIGPVPAVRRLLERQRLTLDEIDLIELNEAFASQGLATLRLLGIADDDPRVNRNGGAIALGHPLGMSGARLAGTAALELALTRDGKALATMCIGVGQGIAIALERV